MFITAITLLGATPTLIYKCGPLQQLQIHHFLMSNGENNINTIQAFVVPEGATPSLSNQVIYNYKLAANSYIEILKDAIVDVGHSLYAQSADPQFVCCFMCGELITSG